MHFTKDTTFQKQDFHAPNYVGWIKKTFEDYYAPFLSFY